MTEDGPNMQNDFFNRARRETAPVTIYLTNGKKLSGRIKSFDRFTVILSSNKVDQMIFKHAISTVCLGMGPTSPPRREIRDRALRSDERAPHEGYGQPDEPGSEPTEEPREQEV